MSHPTHITELSPTCTTVRRGAELTIALNRDGNDAGRVTPQDAWKLLSVLEAYMDAVGAPR